VLLSEPLARCAGAPRTTAVAAEPDALAGRLRRLAADPAARAELDRASRRLARHRAWPAVADRHLDVYEEVTHGRGASRRSVRAG
jgi:glycosyltransferase involved in cell wall biosynthesis